MRKRKTWIAMLKKVDRVSRNNVLGVSKDTEQDVLRRVWEMAGEVGSESSIYADTPPI
jgi:hypothetical protein